MKPTKPSTQRGEMEPFHHRSASQGIKMKRKEAFRKIEEAQKKLWLKRPIAWILLAVIFCMAFGAIAYNLLAV